MSTKTSGFSLIEILVVLFVISIMVTLASVNISSDQFRDRLATEIKHLTRVASFALDEAQLSGRDYGLFVGRMIKDNENVFYYRWSRLSKNGWVQPKIDADTFAEGFFDPRIQVELELDDSPFSFVDIERLKTPSTPQIIFYSSGETNPGRLLWRSGETGEILYEIEWNIFGKFSSSYDLDDKGKFKR